MDVSSDKLIIENFIKKYGNLDNDYSLFTSNKFLNVFRENYISYLEIPASNDSIIVEFVSTIEDLKEYWNADFRVNNNFHALGDCERFLKEIKILFYNDTNISKRQIINNNSFDDLFSGYHLFAILYGIIEENKIDSNFFDQQVTNGKIGYLLRRIKQWFDFYNNDFENTAYKPWNICDKLYSKIEVQDLMARRVNRTHRAFFERYKVESLQQLDDLFKGKEIIKADTTDSLLNIEGLRSQKNVLNNLINYYQKNKKYDSKEKFVYCFTGNPGTGKSLFGRLISDKLFSLGLIHTNRFIEYSAHQLAYSGCAKTFELAAGGVLYISDVDMFEDDDSWFYREYGKKTLHDMIHEIDTYNENMIIILAGSKVKVDRVLNQNKSLKSRVFEKVDFPDYTVEDIKLIACNYINTCNYNIEKSAVEELSKVDEYFRKIGEYANARTIISIIRNLFVIQSKRTSNDETNRTITIEDVRNYEKEAHIIRQINESIKSSHSMLDRLIGLKKVKEQVLRFRAFALKHREDFALNNNLHMCFTGNPGTGKTEVAKLLARILYEDGILPQDKLVMVTRADLVAEYVGQTAPKTRKCINDALGGVLFIDEAYSLLTGYGSNYDYGAEAIAELVSGMEENKGKLMVIFAGYKFETMRLINSNSGLRSRVNHFIDFENYKIDELEKIMDLMLNESNYKVNEKCRNEIKQLLKMMKEDDSFGNARVVRKILEKLYEVQALRTIKKPEDNLINESDFNKIKNDDEFIKYYKNESNYKIDVKKIDSFSNQTLKNVDDEIKECTVLIKIKENGKLVGEGTGFFIDENGLIATNAHVAEEGELFVDVNFRLSNDSFIIKEYECRLIKLNKTHDIAIIQIIKPDAKYKYIPLSKDFEYEKMIRKEFCMAGFPLGGSRFKNVTVNHGYIQSYNKDSALDEKRKDLDWVFMEISGGHPGNSGSSVVCNGKCIAIFSGVSISGDVKIRHAIPVKYLWELISKKKGGK